MSRLLILRRSNGPWYGCAFCRNDNHRKCGQFAPRLCFCRWLEHR